MRLKNYDRAVATADTADTARYLLQTRAVTFTEENIQEAQAQTKADGTLMNWTFKPSIEELVALLAQDTKSNVLRTLSDTQTLVAHTSAGWWLVQQLSEKDGQPLQG